MSRRQEQTGEVSATGVPNEELEAVYGSELVGLLDELAGQEERRLLGRLAHWKRPKLAHAAECLRPGSPFLSKLERHLLSVYRDELGELMQEACYAIFLEDPAFLGRVVPHRGKAGKPILPRSLMDRRRDLSQLGRVPSSRISELSSAIELLDRHLEPAPRRKSELLVFAFAGSQVRPSDAMNIYVGQGFAALTDFDEARRRLSHVVTCPMRSVNRGVAANALAYLEWHAGKPSVALDWARVASSGKDSRPIAAISYAFYSLLAGSSSHLQQALQLLAEYHDPQDPTIQAHCQRLRAERFAGTWNPEPDLSLFSRLKAGQFHGHEQKIKAVFL